MTMLPRHFSEEILSNVCAFLYYDDEAIGRQTLSAFARTCRAFYGPSMDSLWQSLPTIAPLMLTMPPDLFETELFYDWCDRPRQRMSFVRPLVPQDFARFVTYAPRVKSLGKRMSSAFDSHSRYSVSPSVYEALHVYRPTRSLLPNLQRLIWAGSSSKYGESLPWIHIFFTPTLRTLVLSAPMPLSIHLTHMLKKLTTRCPQLEELNLEISESGPDHGIISEDMSCFRRLKHFRCNTVALTPEAMCSLATLPTLHIMEACIREETEGDAVSHLDVIRNSDAQRVFVSLHHLSLTLDNISTLTQLISHMRPSRMVKMAVSVRNMPTCLEVEEFFFNLSSLRTRKLLQILKFEVLADDTPMVSLSPETLQPLLILNMKFLTIEGCHVDVDDEMLRTMALAWPRLVRLHLGARRPPSALPRATLAGLIPLVQYCPRLTYIGLVLDTDLQNTTLDLEQRPGGGVVSRRVEELDLGNSTVTNPIAVASFLSDLFPRLWFIGTTWPSGEEDDSDAEDADIEMFDRWDQVQRLSHLFAKARYEERNWHD